MELTLVQDRSIWEPENVESVTVYVSYRTMPASLRCLLDSNDNLPLTPSNPLKIGKESALHQSQSSRHVSK